MATATVTSKGQITIPKEVRDALGLESGDRVTFVTDEDGRVGLRPATKDIRSLKGMIPPPAQPVSVEEMKATVRARGAGK